MVYTVGEMAKLMGVPASTLRYYDKEGLLPFVERSSGGMRMFQEKDYEWLRIIECLKKTGMPLRDIRAYTAAPGDYAAPRALVEAASAFAFTSAAGARAALERLAPLPEGVLLAALGAPTARALAASGGRLVTAAEPSSRALAKAIAENIM